MVLHDVNLVLRFCTHSMLMIDPDTILSGPVTEVITADNLQRLYRHPIKQIKDNGGSFFFPE